MEKKVVDCDGYKIHSIKTDRYKTTQIEIIFRVPATKGNLAKNAFLANMLSDSSEKYPTQRTFAIKLEDLYQTYYGCSSHKIGQCLHTVFTLKFINPEYIKEKNYLKNVITFFIENITKPNVQNKAFDLELFNIKKDEILLDIAAIEESPDKMAINNALSMMDSSSITALRALGTKQDVEAITPENLYKYYLDLFANAMIDVFVAGDTDMGVIIQAIQDVFKVKSIKEKKLKYFINNAGRKKVLYKEDISNFVQSQFVAIYNIADLTKEEREVVFHVFNFILGSGGLSSKLYRYIREENSYCYRISSMYFKYDNLLCIASSLAKENINHTIKLMKKAIKEMQKGKFTDDDLMEAKQNLISSLKISKNTPRAIFGGVEFKTFIGNYDDQEKIALLERITKEDVINVAKKIKANIYYVLSEGTNERN